MICLTISLINLYIQVYKKNPMKRALMTLAIAGLLGFAKCSNEPILKEGDKFPPEDSIKLSRLEIIYAGECPPYKSYSIGQDLNHPYRSTDYFVACRNDTVVCTWWVLPSGPGYHFNPCPPFVKNSKDPFYWKPKSRHCK
jgi:hypothetical protein